MQAVDASVVIAGFAAWQDGEGQPRAAGATGGAMESGT